MRRSVAITNGRASIVLELAQACVGHITNKRLALNVRLWTMEGKAVQIGGLCDSSVIEGDLWYLESIESDALQ